MYVSTGSGVKNVLTDEFIKSVIEDMKSQLKAGETDEAIVDGVGALCQKLMTGRTWGDVFWDVVKLLFLMFTIGAVFAVLFMDKIIIPVVQWWERKRSSRYKKEKARLDQLREDLQNNKRIPATLCPICLTDFEEQDEEKKTGAKPKSTEKLETLCCGHQFHFNCIDAWLKTNNTCPICRQQRPRDPPSTDSKGPSPPQDKSDPTLGSNYHHTYISPSFLDFAYLSLNTRYSDVVTPRPWSTRLQSWVPRSSGTSSGGSYSSFGGGSSYGGGGAGGSW